MTNYTTQPALETITAVGHILDAMSENIKYLDDRENVLLVSELNRIFDEVYGIQEALYKQWTNAVSASIFRMRDAK